jgi:hypothetical protein
MWLNIGAGRENLKAPPQINLSSYLIRHRFFILDLNPTLAAL